MHCHLLGWTEKQGASAKNKCDVDNDMGAKGTFRVPGLKFLATLLQGGLLRKVFTSELLLNCQ